MPECDASVVTQVLDAGATVVGKANQNFLHIRWKPYVCKWSS